MGRTCSPEHPLPLQFTFHLIQRHGYHGTYVFSAIQCVGLMDGVFVKLGLIYSHSLMFVII